MSAESRETIRQWASVQSTNHLEKMLSNWYKHRLFERANETFLQQIEIVKKELADRALLGDQQ